MDRQEVDVSFLREAASVLFDHLENQSGAAVAINGDYFWSVPADEIENPYSTPSNLTLGQYSETLGNLESIVANKEDVISFGLVWLGDLLKGIGYRELG